MAIIYPEYDVMTMAFTFVGFLPQTYNPSLFMRKTPDKSQLEDSLQSNK